MSEDNQVVKVKFKGKFSLGQSQRYPAANVSEDFLSNLTDLNRILLKLSNLPVPSEKKAPDSPPATRSKKRLEEVKVKSEAPALPPAVKKLKTSETAKNSNSAPNEAPPEVRDPTVGILSLPPGRNLESQSTYFTSAQNAKMFAKSLATMDPVEMKVQCDFDFWVWLEAQKYFHPFSTSSHDVQVLELLDIGENNPWLAYSSTQPLYAMPVEPDSSSGPVTDVVGGALTSKSKELLKVNLQVNQLLANIRRQLQTPAVRNEQASLAKSLEKDKSVVNRWSKAKKKHK